MLRELMYGLPRTWELTDQLRGTATRNFVHSRHAPVLVASLGRAGSTMICESIIEADCRAARLTYRGWMLFEPAWQPRKVLFRSGGVYKTHASRCPLPEVVRTVFVYDDPYQIVGSLLAKLRNGEFEWLKTHSEHLTGHAAPVDNILNEDVLKLKENFLSWTSPRQQNIFYAHYDDLWRNESELGAFLGVDLKMPKRETRSSYLEKLPEEGREAMIKTYGDLQDLTEKFRSGT